MVKDFKGQVKIADVQAAFDEIVGKVNSLVESYNVQGSVEDIDYTIGGANLAPSGYTLSVGGMKQFLKACEGCVVGGKPFKVDDTHIKLSTGMVVSPAGIQRLPDSVLEVKGKTLWWDSYNKRYTWTGNVPRKEFFTFKQEEGIWYTYLKKGTYTVTYKNNNTGEYEPKQLTFNKDLKFPSYSFQETSGYYASILTPVVEGSVPIKIFSEAGTEPDSSVTTGAFTNNTYGSFSGNEFSDTISRTSYVTITPESSPEGLTQEYLTYTWRVPYKLLADGGRTHMLADQRINVDFVVTRSGNTGDPEVIDTFNWVYNVPAEVAESKKVATVTHEVKLNQPLQHGESLNISIVNKDSRMQGTADAWRGEYYGIWGANEDITLYVYLGSKKTSKFTKKINLIVEDYETPEFSQISYMLDSVEGYYDNYSDLGYFTWDTDVYTDRPVEWGYVEDGNSSISQEVAEGVYRVCDVNMNSSSKFVGTVTNIAAENINGKFDIYSQDRDYTSSGNYIRVQRNGGTSCYNALDTSNNAKFVSALTADVSSDHSGGNDIYLFGTHVTHVGYQGHGRGEYYFPMTYLFIPKGVENPYTYYDSWRKTTNPNASCQKVLNVTISKQIRTENK